MGWTTYSDEDKDWNLLLIITSHLKLEHILRPSLCVRRPSSCLFNLYPQIYNFPFSQFFDSMKYCPTVSRGLLGSLKGGVQEGFFWGGAKIQWRCDFHFHPPTLYDSLLSLQVVYAIIRTRFWRLLFTFLY